MVGGRGSVGMWWGFFLKKGNEFWVLFFRMGKYMGEGRTGVFGNL